MKILNFGSLNIDNVYRVHQIVRPGETISSLGYEIHCGGKGLNQSVALGRAGMETRHAGVVGTEDGQILLDMLESGNVDTSLVQKIPGKSGHCIIQVDDNGQNCIFLHGGANHAVTDAYIDQVLGGLGKGDLLLLQNEINAMDRILQKAKEKELYVILNPSPMNSELMSLDLSGVRMFILNEVEGGDLTGEQEPELILKKMRQLYPEAEIVLTLGSRGAIYAHGELKIRQEIFRLKAVDTTAAGDTFTGFFISEYFSSGDVKKALELASKASSIAVTKEGAAPSIPWRDELD